MIETAQAFGVDIGGSGIKAAPVNLEKGEFAEPRLKILTPEVSIRRPLAKSFASSSSILRFLSPLRSASHSRSDSCWREARLHGQSGPSLGLAWTSPKCSQKLAAVRSPW